MRRIAGVLLVVMALAGLVRGETLEALPKPTGYVNDFAGVLSAADRLKIEGQCTVLHQKSGTQVAVVTIKRLEGVTAQEFAHGVSDAWGVGSKGTDKGIVMLVVTEDRKRWIDVGYGLEGVLNDAKVGDIGRAMVPALHDGRFGEGLSLGLDLISTAVLADAQVASVPAPRPPDNGGVGPLTFFGVLAGVIFVILLARRRRRQREMAFWSGATGPRAPVVRRASEYPGTGWTAPVVDPTAGASSSFASPSSSATLDSGSSASSTSFTSDFGGFDGGSSGGGGAGGDF